MTDATPGQKAMARRIVADQYQRIRDHDYARWILDGLKDETQGVKIALAAIIETQRLDAELAWKMAGKQMPAYAVGEAIRAGHHYGKDTD